MSGAVAHIRLVEEPVERPLTVKAIDLALTSIARYGRADLEDRLRQARARLLADHVRVLVVGEFKQGKSMLVNALLSAPVCPVFDDVATSVSTVVGFAEQPELTLVRPGAGDGPAGEQRTRRTDVALTELSDVVAGYVTESNNPQNAHGLSHVEIGIPRNILRAGLQVVDTPGVGGLTSVHGAATMAALPSADAVLLVSDASQEYTAPELEFLRAAIRLCPNVACVLTKIDMYPEWRRIAELDRRHLADAGIAAELIAVSSAVRWQAVLGDETLNEESGFPRLEGYLAERVLGQADLLSRRSTVHDIVAVTDQLCDGLRSEEASHRDPEGVQELIRTLRRSQERAAALKERSARWQLTLNDGVADLNADIDYDLRDRFREITRLAEDELAAVGDPTKVWDQFAGWVQQEVANAAAANFVWATQRVRYLAGQVAEHFSADRDQLLPALRNDPSDALRSVRQMVGPKDESFGLGNKMLTGMKGGYMGMLMFGMLGSIVFGTLFNPIGIGAGIVMAGKSVGDERKRIVTKRQNEAKAAARRYVDDVTFQVSTDSRKRLRAVQRDLRNHFTEQAEQLKRTLTESQQAAERAVKASQSERDARRAEITAELEALEVVRRQVRALLPRAAPTANPTAAPVKAGASA